jgi:hypothetical protein
MPEVFSFLSPTSDTLTSLTVIDYSSRVKTIHQMLFQKPASHPFMKIRYVVSRAYSMWMSAHEIPAASDAFFVQSRPRCRIKETIQKSAKGVTKKLSVSRLPGSLILNMADIVQKPFKCFRNRTPANQNANLRDALTTVVQNPETEGASSSQKNEVSARTCYPSPSIFLQVPLSFQQQASHCSSDFQRPREPRVAWRACFTGIFVEYFDFLL